MPSSLSKEALERNATLRARFSLVLSVSQGDFGAALFDNVVLSTFLPATPSERDAAVVGSVFALAAPLEIPAAAKLGVAGGPGAGKDFGAWVKDAAREQSPTCVFCGEPTTLTVGPSQSNIDHALPKSRLGNNTLENAQKHLSDLQSEEGQQDDFRVLGVAVWWERASHRNERTQTTDS